MARESRTLAAAAAGPLERKTAAGGAGAKRGAENVFTTAREHAAGSVVSEVADGNRRKRIPASETVARKSPASAGPAVTAFGSFEERA